MSIDWDNAPEGATHWNGIDGAEWFKLDAGKWFYYSFTLSKWVGSVNRTKWYDTLMPRPTPPKSDGMIEIATGKRWEVVYMSSDFAMFKDGNGSAYSVATDKLDQYFTSVESPMTERQRFDAVMARSDWSGFDKDQRGVLWEMWKEARGISDD